MEVKESKQGYPETVFASQAKGSALHPRYRHNDWIYFIYSDDVSEVIGKLSLVFNENIKDECDRGCTIRILETKEKKSKTSLFAEKEIHLRALNDETEPIVIKNIAAEQNVEIVGLEYSLI